MKSFLISLYLFFIYCKREPVKVLEMDPSGRPDTSSMQQWPRLGTSLVGLHDPTPGDDVPEALPPPADEISVTITKGLVHEIYVQKTK